MTDYELLAVLDALTERVSLLEAHRTAGDLMHRYAESLDDPDPDHLSSLFTPSGILRTPGAEYRGRSAIAGFFASARDRDPSDKRHFVCQPAFAPDEPGTVSLHCYFLYTARGAGGSILGWGTYDALCRTGSGPAQFDLLTISPHATAGLTAITGN